MSATLAQALSLSKGLSIPGLAVRGGGWNPAWAVGALHAFDFTSDQARFNSAYVGPISNTPNWSFSRASTGYALNAAGVWVAFSSGSPRRTDRGLLMEGAATNKCANYNANPTDTTGTTKGGDAAATLTVVDDSAALAAAGLSSICSSGKVYKLDNSGGASYATVQIGGATGNTNPHTFSVYARRTTPSNNANLTGSGSFPGSTAIDASGVYKRYSLTGTPASTGDRFQVAALAGAVVYFILNQTEEASFVSSPIVTTGASATRAADSAGVTLSGLTYPLSMFAEFERAVDTGSAEVLANVSDGSSSNRAHVYVNSSDVAEGIADTGGVNQMTLSASTAHAVGVVGKVAMRVATNDGRVASKGALSSPDTSVTLPASPSLLKFGSNQLGTAVSYGYLRRAAIFNRALTDAELESITT